MRDPSRPGTRSPGSAMGLGGFCGRRSAIPRYSLHRTMPAGCSIASRMSNRTPADNGRGESTVWRLVARRSALVLLVTTAGSAGVPAAELVFDITIEHGRVPDIMHLMRVHEGDAVRLRWTSDRPLVLHLHGYDIEQRVAADAVAELKFTASATGRFPIHAHPQRAGAGGHMQEDAPLAIIEVHPR